MKKSDINVTNLTGANTAPRQQMRALISIRRARTEKVMRDNPTPTTSGERTNLLEKATEALQARSYPLLSMDDWGVLNAMPIGIAVGVRSTGRFVQVNNAYANYLGYTPQELEYEMTWMELVVEFSEEDLKRQVECFEIFGGDMVSPRKWRHKDGHTVTGKVQYFTCTTRRIWSGQEATEDDSTLELIGCIAYFDSMTNREGIVAAHATMGSNVLGR